MAGRGVGLLSIRNKARTFDAAAIVKAQDVGNECAHRLRFRFEYWRVKDGVEKLVARGEQQIACLRREGEKLLPTPAPKSMREAQKRYR